MAGRARGSAGPGPAGPAPARAALEEYVTAIEAVFTRQAGRVRRLHPHDFALARGWHAAGVPLACVLGEIERAFDTRREPLSLAYLRRHVEARAAQVRDTLRPAESPAAACDGTVTREWLERVRAWLDDHAPADGAPAFAAARAALDAFERHAREGPADGAARAALDDALDDALGAAASATLDAATLERLRAEAARALARQRGRLDPRALDEALQRHLRRRARELAAVPRRG